MAAPSGARLFEDRDGRPRVVRGAILVSGAPRLAELAARIGFDTVWIEMEHGHIGHERAEDLCRAAEVGGAAATARISSVQRQHVLRALEIGATVVVAPMVNTVADARALVRHGKFSPLGQRGFNSRSRGMNYGLRPIAELMANANRDTHLIAQIETVEATANLDAILAVEGLAGILIGPGDLSTSMGIAARLDDPALVDTVVACIRRARAAGRHAGILAAPGRLLEAALAAGCDLVYFAGDLMDLGAHWPRILASVDPTPGGSTRR